MPLPDKKILKAIRFKTFADNNLNVAKMVQFFLCLDSKT